MAAQLPYLPPIERYRNDVASIAANTAEDVAAANGVAAKTGVGIRGALAAVPPIVAGANDVAATPGRFVGHQMLSFLSNLFGGPQPATPAVAPAAPPAPTLGLPALAMPGVQSGSSTTAAPATHEPVAPGTLVSSRTGNNITITGDRPAPEPVAELPVLYRSNPVATGIAQQAAYAEAQRQAVMAAAAEAAANGHPDNASYRYAAALHALPTLSGANNFASAQGQFAGELASVGERERSNIRTTGEARYATQERAQEVRRNAQPTVIGEEINPDPTTRMFAPTIKRYGFVERDDKTGKIVVRDMQGVEQKPPAPPVSRSEFITRNGKANPDMTPAELGREWDRKYGGKS